MPNYIVQVPLITLIPWVALIAQSILFIISEAAHRREGEREARAYQALRRYADELLRKINQQGAEDGK